MSDKNVHIVFQVLNFLHDAESKKFKLLPIDKFILITLASHKGIKGIFPAQETLAYEVGIKERHLRDRIRHLEKTGLIWIEKIGRKHYYHLQELSTIPAPQCRNEETIPAPQCLSHRHHSAANTGTTVPHKNKVSNKLNKIERARVKPRLPLSDQFEPTIETINSAKALGLSKDELNEEHEKFMDYYLADGCKKSDWQLALLNWFERAVEYKNKNPQRNEIRSTVKEFEPEPRYERPIDNGVATKAIGQIMERLRLNGKGGHNGQGLHGRMEKEKGSKTQ